MAGKPTYEELEKRVKELEKKAFECEKVKDSLKLFSHSFESSIDGVAMGNTENRIIYANEAFAKMFGYSREELVGKEIALIYSDDQIPLLEEALKITMEGGWTGELIGMKKDGTRFPVSVSSSRVLDDQGNVIAHMASHRDITEQKQAVEPLRASEEKWRTLVENSRDAIFITTRDGEFIDFNQSFLDLFGYTEEEMHNINAIGLYIDPNDRVKYVHEVEEEGSLKSYEVKFQTKDGAEIYVLSSAMVRKAHDGSILGYQGIIRDITEQKQTVEALRASEEKWRSLAETAPCVILTVQRDGTIQFLNRTIGNYTPENTIGTKVWDYVPPDHHSVMKKAIEHVFQTGLPIGYEILGAGPEGPASAWYMTQLGPIVKDGQVVVVTMVSTDITETKKVHEELRESEAQKKAILDATIDRIRLVDTDMRIIWANQTHARELNIHPEEIIGHRCYTIFVNRDTPCSECPSIKAIKSARIEHSVLTRPSPGNKEEKIYLDSYAVPLKNESGDIERLIQVTRNVTEQVLAEKTLRESEEKYRTILESIEEGYYEIDMAGNFTFFNDSICKMFGYSRDELLGMNNREYTDKKTAEKVYKIFNKVHKTGKPKNMVDVEIIRKNGGRSNIEASVSLMKDSQGNAIGFRGIFRDVTERKRAERAMKKREAELAIVNKQLIETNRALSVLAKNLDTTQKESEKRIIQRIRSYIIPIIEKLRQDKNIERYRADFDLLTSYIRNLTSDLANDIKIALALSTTELRVASLIRNGMSNQEIAKHLYITDATVKTHRRNIRRKLDLHNSGINLKAYMKSELDQE